MQTTQPQLWIPELELGLGVWSGTFERIDHSWLRWCDLEGNWLLTDTELEAKRANRALERAESESQRANEAEGRLRQVIGNLRQSGMETKAIAEIVGSSMEDIDTIDEHLA